MPWIWHAARDDATGPVWVGRTSPWFTTSTTTGTWSNLTNSASTWSVTTTNDLAWQRYWREDPQINTAPPRRLARPAVHRARSPLEEMRMRHEEARAAAHREAQAVQAVRGDQEAVRYRAAAERARQLFLSHLSPEQRDQYDRDRSIIVVGQSGRRYRIRDNPNGSVNANIDVLRAGNDNVVDYRLCAHCRLGTVPHHDHLLTQKVHLELAEDAFVQRANRHG